MFKIRGTINILMSKKGARVHNKKKDTH